MPAARVRRSREKPMNSRIKITLAMCGALTGACQGPGASGSAPAEATSASAAVAATPAPAAPTTDKGPIKVGILHSLSGTMAISETSLKDVALMTIDGINKAGGLLGRQLEPVVVDPASDWPMFAQKAKELIQKDGVAVTSRNDCSRTPDYLSRLSPSCLTGGSMPSCLPPWLLVSCGRCFPRATRPRKTVRTRKPSWCLKWCHWSPVKKRPS